MIAWKETICRIIFGSRDGVVYSVTIISTTLKGFLQVSDSGIDFPNTLPTIIVLGTSTFRGYTEAFSFPAHGNKFGVASNNSQESWRLCHHPRCPTCQKSPEAYILHVDCVSLFQGLFRPRYSRKCGSSDRGYIHGQVHALTHQSFLSH